MFLYQWYTANDSHAKFAPVIPVHNNERVTKVPLRTFPSHHENDIRRTVGSSVLSLKFELIYKEYFTSAQNIASGSLVLWTFWTFWWKPYLQKFNGRVSDDNVFDFTPPTHVYFQALPCHVRMSSPARRRTHWTEFRLSSVHLLLTTLVFVVRSVVIAVRGGVDWCLSNNGYRTTPVELFKTAALVPVCLDALNQTPESN